MDNAGAVLGPAAAAALIAFGLQTRQVFFAAGVPALVVMVVLAVGVRERGEPRAPVDTPPPEPGALRALGHDYRRLLVLVVLFTLGNSSDMFLLFRLSDAGLAPEAVTLTWAAHNALRTAATYFGGPLADRIDRRRLLAAGWITYALIYAALALVASRWLLVVLVIAYALHYGAVEPTERALVAELCPPERRGSAFGWFHGAIGMAALPASAMAGVLWKVAGPGAAFGVGAVFAFAATVGLIRLLPPPPRAGSA
jgi:MFS family permease